MEEKDIRKIIFDCLNDEHFISELKSKIFNMNGLKTQAEFDEQINRISEFEREKQNFSKTIEELRDKINEYENVNDDLTSKLDQVKAQYKNDELKLEQYRTDMKSYLSKLEEQEKELAELEQENKTLQTQLNETNEHFKTASAESMKNLQEVKRESEHVTELENKIASYENTFFDYVVTELKSKSEQGEKFLKIFDEYFNTINSGNTSIYVRLEPAVGGKYDKETMQLTKDSAKKGDIAKVLIAGYKDRKGKVIKRSLVKLKNK